MKTSTVVKITKRSDISRLSRVQKIAEKNLIRSLKKLMTKKSFLSSLKYTQVGFDPWSPSAPMHIIEQINMNATYSAALEAVKYLIEKHSEIRCWQLSPGHTNKGPDIVSDDSSVVAEVFAATKPSNNSKLMLDTIRVRKLTSKKIKHRYVFFQTSSTPLEAVKVQK